MKIKNEAELLNKLCDKTHIKDILTEPFFNTNYNEVWSSDGVVLIRINPKARQRSCKACERNIAKVPRGDRRISDEH